jgi:uncharacterized protein (DUF305 family)
MRLKATLAIIAAVFSANAAYAQHAHHGHGAPTSQSAAQSPAVKAFADANARMHRDMAVALTGNADADFVRGMIPHHQGAVDVSEIVLKFGKDAEVRKLATHIIAEQKIEIAQMKAWIAANPSPAASPEAEAIRAAYGKVNAQMHADMSAPLAGNPDADFVRGMIPHHMGAVEMAKVLLQFGKDETLRTLAQNIIRTQNIEITQMRTWLKTAQK